jgi:hypothetical protein
MVVVRRHYVIVLVVKKRGGGAATISGLLFISNKWGEGEREWRSNLLVVEFSNFHLSFSIQVNSQTWIGYHTKGVLDFF